MDREDAGVVPWVERALQSDAFQKDVARALASYKNGREAGYNTLVSEEDAVSIGFAEGTADRVATLLASGDGYRTLHTHYHPRESEGFPVPSPSNTDLNSHDYRTIWGLQKNPRDRQAAAIGKQTDDGLYFLVYQRRNEPGYLDRWLMRWREKRGTVEDGRRRGMKRFKKYLFEGIEKEIKDNGVGWIDRKVALYECRAGVNGRGLDDLYRMAGLDTRRLAEITAEALERTGRYVSAVVRAGEGATEWLYGDSRRFV